MELIKLLNLIEEAYAAPDDVFFVVRDGVIAFRGTENIDDWKVDADVRKVPYEVSLHGAPGTFAIPAGQVHSGFLHRWNQIRQAVIAAIGSTAPLTITGHSLGGAMATLCALELHMASWPVELITFGCPRVGDRYFARLVHRNVKITRVENWGDPVPWVPAYLRGWRHAGEATMLGSLGTLFHARHHALAAYRQALSEVIA